MIECIFTIDYEIYGNGHGTLKELVYEPARKLKAIFDRANAKFVVFAEALELEKIEQAQTDCAIADVKRQVKGFYNEGFEIALHLHPQWCNARYQSENWLLDAAEYNLCPLGHSRITEIVQQAITYLRGVLGDTCYKPLSFRAGNWLFQPTATAAQVLAGEGVRIDSSVFKGGLQHKHGLDYRQTHQNGYHWRFQDEVTKPTSTGSLLEIPIYTRMVPFWQLLTGKRLSLQNKAPSRNRTFKDRVDRLRDLLRFRQPIKFDFCRMTLSELVATMEKVIRDDRHSPELFKPIVAIGHTKDLVDLGTVEAFLDYLRSERIAVSTLEGVYHKCFPSVHNTITHYSCTA